MFFIIIVYNHFVIVVLLCQVKVQSSIPVQSSSPVVQSTDYKQLCWHDNYSLASLLSLNCAYRKLYQPRATTYSLDQHAC